MPIGQRICLYIFADELSLVNNFSALLCKNSRNWFDWTKCNGLLTKAFMLLEKKWDCRWIWLCVTCWSQNVFWCQSIGSYQYLYSKIIDLTTEWMIQSAHQSPPNIFINTQYAFFLSFVFFPLFTYLQKYSQAAIGTNTNDITTKALFYVCVCEL